MYFESLDVSFTFSLKLTKKTWTLEKDIGNFWPKKASFTGQALPDRMTGRECLEKALVSKWTENIGIRIHKKNWQQTN